jgi:serine/threonine-protein kinase
MTEPVDQTETLAGGQVSTPAPEDARPAQAANPLLGGRYRLLDLIASGGMATVWRARDEVLARIVAVKLLHDHLAADAAFRERFRREAIAAAKLTHPNVIGLYDTGRDDDRVYLVMEFLEGTTLKQVIARDGHLSIGQTATIGERVARALHYAHERGLVHRDVKPANILIGDDGAVKVADFGIAKAEEADDLTKTGMVLGTAAYVAPEQILAQPLSGKADQYALGCVLYEALSGRQPFKGDSAVATAALRLEREPTPLRTVRTDVPHSLDEIVMRAMARRPEDRFPSAGHLADALSLFAVADVGLTVALVPPLHPLLDEDLDERTDPSGEVLTRAGAAVGTPRRRQRRRSWSFLREEGRWLAPVLVLLLLAGALVGVGLATGILRTEGGFPIIAARDGGQTRSAQRIAAISGQSFDPQGQGTENQAAVANAFDGDPQTSWRTEGYASPSFGNLKSGVGFWVDLGARHTLERVEVVTTTPGISYELRVADAPTAIPEGWRRVAAVAAAGGRDDLRFDEPQTARYLLIWVTGNLQPIEGRHRAAFSEVTVTGGPA